MPESRNKVISFSSYSPFESNEQLYDTGLAKKEKVDLHNIITCFKFRKNEFEKVLDLVDIDSIVKQMSYGLIKKDYETVYIGLLPNEDSINLISDYTESRCFNSSIVVRADFFDHDNALIFDQDYIAAFSRRLLLIADLIICDIKNLSLLTGMEIETMDDWQQAGEILRTTGVKNICVFDTEMQRIVLLIEDGERRDFFVPVMQYYQNLEFYNLISELVIYVAAGDFYPAAIKKVVKKLERLYALSEN